MKKLVLIALLVTGFSHGQLHVSDNSYVFVNDTFLFVGNFGDANPDINLVSTDNTNYTLADNGYIFLRNEGMLLQAATNSSENSGDGKLSVFQTGTQNEFGYNYWGVPVRNPLVDLSNPANNFNFTVGLYDPTTPIDDPTVAAYIPSLDGNGSPLQISEQWLFKFEGGTVTANFERLINVDGVGDVTQISSFAPGLGFTMKGTIGSTPTAGQTYDFRGEPNNGDINIAVTENTFTLLGNPYPSAMDLQAFLTDPDNAADIDQTAYFWQQDAITGNSHQFIGYIGGYATYVPTPGTGTFTPATLTTFDADGNDLMTDEGTGDTKDREIIPIAQGFFVEGIEDTGDPAFDGIVIFKNSHRVFFQANGNAEFEFQEIEEQNDILLNGAAPGTAQNNTSSFVNAENSDKQAIRVADKRTPIITDYSRIYFNMYVGNDNLLKTMALSFFDQATDGYDNGADGRGITALTNDIYFPIEGDDRYAIYATNFDFEKEIPLTVIAQEKSTYRISIREKENFEHSQVFVHDNETGDYYEITNGEAFEIALDAGRYENRFTISFQEIPSQNEDDTADDDQGDDDAPGDDDIVAEDPFTTIQEVDAFQNNTNKQLTVQNNSNLNVATISLFDITGKVIFTENVNSTSTSFSYSTGQYTSGIYLLNVEVRNGTNITKKIAINN